MKKSALCFILLLGNVLTFIYGYGPIDISRLQERTCHTWKRHWGGMKGCPEFGCLRLTNLEDAKEICIQDKTCNGVLSCPYSECHLFEIRRGPTLTTNHWPYLEENVLQLTRLPCEDKPTVYPTHVVEVENESIVGSLSGTVSLKCFVKSFPIAITFWTKQSNHPEYFDKLIEEGRRYKLDRKTISGPKNNTAYNKVLTLTIINFSAKDAGTYICVSRNVVGKKEKKISVHTNECITTGGNKPGTECKFPFIYETFDDLSYVPVSILRLFSRKIQFDNCTDFKNSGINWCATKTTSDNRYIEGEWGECPDTLACNLNEGSWLNWSRWSPWTKCGIGRKIDSHIGVRSRKRIREKYSRQKITTLTLNDKLLINFFFDNHTSYDSPTPDRQISSEACEMPQPTGWMNIDCRRQLNSVMNRKEYLISFVDTKDECKALCDASPYCNLAIFDTWTLKDSYYPLTRNYSETVVKNNKKFSRCQLGKKLSGICDKCNHGDSCLQYISYAKDSSIIDSGIETNMKWKWNAIKSGSSYDCRLCNQWDEKSRCHKDCSIVPQELLDMKFLLKYARNRKMRLSVRTGGSFGLLKLLNRENYWEAYEKATKILEASWNRQHKNSSEFPIIFDSRDYIRSRQVRERKRTLYMIY